MIISFLTLAYLMGPVVSATVESHSVAAIVASQIRRQGFLCEDPISAQRVAVDSAPSHTVYILQCRKWLTGLSWFQIKRPWSTR
jgi:hypothetical protein